MDYISSQIPSIHLQTATSLFSVSDKIAPSPSLNSAKNAAPHPSAMS